MKNYGYALFDLDGTLTDPGEGITNSVAYALEKMNIPIPPRQELYKFIGPPLVDSFMQYFGLTPENAQKAVSFYREYFKDKGLFENVVFPGAKELLIKLKEQGVKTVIATSKPEVFAIRILERFELYSLFDVVCGADMEGKRSAKADVIAYALDAAHIQTRADAIMIGDRLHDVIGAKQNGLKSIGVTFGYGTREELIAAGADYIADSFDGVYDIII